MTHFSCTQVPQNIAYNTKYIQQGSTKKSYYINKT